MKPFIKILTIAAALVCLHASVARSAESLDRTGTLWVPFLEWSLENRDYKGNPFDLQASATFTHTQSGETRTTGMFHDGVHVWKFRFAAPRSGVWTFITRSAAPALDGKQGTVTIKPDPTARGFITSADGNRWAWQIGETGERRLFVPQLAMGRDLAAYAKNPDLINRDIQVFLKGHGFNGIHVGVLCRWFDFEQVKSDRVKSRDPNPDPRTFELLEQIITRVHHAGGMVHLWAWGDEQRRMTPIRWGINGKVDQRLQSYIAARLGPIPGWTMGYGFDLWEWVDGKQLASWHSYMSRQFGWPHLLSGRWTRNSLSQATEVLDYASFEQHRPSYDIYLASILKRSGKPAFSEDRFRVRDPSPYPDKDYDLDMTRRSLWHSTLVGGVANIWGYLVPEADQEASRPYPNRNQIRTWARFFEHRFSRGMRPRNEFTDYKKGVPVEKDGVRACFGDPKSSRFVFYAEDTDSVWMKLGGLSASQPAVAVDVLKAYKEIDLGHLKPVDQRWSAPYRSTWAIAVGSF